MLVLAIAFAAVALLVFLVASRKLKLDASAAVFVTLIVTAILRTVDVRKEITR